MLNGCPLSRSNDKFNKQKIMRWAEEGALVSLSVKHTMCVLVPLPRAIPEQMSEA